MACAETRSAYERGEQNKESGTANFGVCSCGQKKMPLTFCERVSKKS